MDKEQILSTLKKLKELSPKRNFKQSIDIILNFRDLDLKKPEHQVNMFVALPYGTGKKISVCAFVDSDMEPRAKESCDETISLEQFERFKAKAAVKKLAASHDVFIAQASIMPKVATVFGRYLGPRGKMPNPKMGGVLAPNANLKQLCGALQKTVYLVTKSEPTVKCRIGNEDSKDEEISENVMAVYSSVVSKLPNDIHNLKSVMLKLTMGPAFAVGAAGEKDKKEAGAKGKAKHKISAPSQKQQPVSEVKGEKEPAPKKEIAQKETPKQAKKNKKV